MTDEEGMNALEDKRALLRPTQIHTAICSWKGLLAWAGFITVVLVFGIILVKLLVPTPRRTSQFLSLSLFVSLLIKIYTYVLGAGGS